MKELSFRTDNKLCISLWGRNIAAFTGQSAKAVVGKKYYTVIPRIVQHNGDALSRVIKKRQQIILKNYALVCLYGSLASDIVLKPLLLSEKAAQVKVILRPHQSCTMARQLGESKKLIDIGKVASMLAHGVRNPLNAIKGAVVYLREKYAEEETLTEFAEIMEDEISRLESFISRFLNSSVLETESHEADLNAMLRKIEAVTSLQMYTRNIQSRYELGAIPPVTVKPFFVEQAILNVINNAIEAMQSGGELVIRTSTIERSGVLFVVAAISDTGPGIPDGTGNSMPEGQQGGRGFGLFITYEILRHHGGYIEIDSKKNQGTTITLFIPSTCKRTSA
ncbi:MAG: HAMP domain-containing sensor histidine kinase [Nitrospirota bacterium]